MVTVPQASSKGPDHPHPYASGSTNRTEYFGPHCRPPAGSLVERLCLDALEGGDVDVSESDESIELVYADGTRFVSTIGGLAGRIRTFPRVALTTELPDLSDPLTRRLFSSYLTCVGAADVKYSLDMKSDARGTLASILRSSCMGQIYVSRTRPGITRANHYHHRKSEKFLVVQGEALVRLRPIDSDSVTHLRLSGMWFEVVDVPPGMVHSIENVGVTDMVLIFWTNEEFDPSDLDTHPADVVPAPYDQALPPQPTQS